MSEEFSEKQREVFFRIHSGLSREGPGSRASTERALSLAGELPSGPRILDIGCGPGAQTLHLAELTGGRIDAVDNHEPYIVRLAAAVEAAGLSGRVFPQAGDMHSLPFAPGSFDLLWAEGSIYNIGLERGLSFWRPLLRERGAIAFTEITWLRDDPPGEVLEFWRKAYPAMGTFEQNAAIVEGAGYSLEEHFVLPQNDWWDGFYGPILRKLPQLKRAYRNDEEALAVVEMEEAEIELYRRYASYYGYVFYIARRT